MTDMIERMATAGYDALSPSALDTALLSTLEGVSVGYSELDEASKQIHRVYIRAALKAIREPTGEMVEAGHRAHTADRGSGLYFDTTKIFQAMIDTPLKTEEPKP